MNREEMLKTLVSAAEKNGDGDMGDAFSPAALEIIKLLGNFRMYTGSLDLHEERENVPDAVKEAIDEMRHEIMRKVNELSPADFRKPEFARQNDEFLGFTPKDGASRVEVIAESEAGFPEAGPIASPEAAPSLPSRQETGVAEILKNSLAKALADKNEEFAKNRLILSFFPIIMESVRQGLGIEVIHRHVADAGFSGSMAELADCLKKQAPEEMAKYTCAKDGAILMKSPVFSGMELEMQWVCPSCGEIAAGVL